MCITANDLVIQEVQPENAEAWHKDHPELCAHLADNMGHDEFTEAFNDPKFVAAYVEEQTR